VTFAHVAAGGGKVDNVNAGASLVLTLGQAVGAGHLVCGGITQGGGVAISSVKDNATPQNTYTVIEAIVDNGVSPGIAIFYLGNVQNGPTTITVTWASALASFRAIVCDEFTGAAAGANPFDKGVSQLQGSAGTGANAVTSGATAALTQTHDLVYGVGANSASGALNTGTSPNAFTTGQVENTSGNNFLSSEYFLDYNSTTGVAATFTNVAGDTNGTAVATFSPLAAGDVLMAQACL
jgi:hypothetical protein